LVSNNVDLHEGGLGIERLGTIGGLIIKSIPTACSYLASTFVEKAISLSRFFQRLFDLAPVVAGVLIHLPALTAILLPTVAGF
jgi:hypothetical protein